MAVKNDYILVIGDEIDLAGKVTDNLNEGYELVGSIISTYNPDSKRPSKMEYCQAMIRKSLPDKEEREFNAHDSMLI